MEKFRKKISILMVGLILLSTSAFAEDATITCSREAVSTWANMRTTMWNCNGQRYSTTSMNIFGTWYVMENNAF